MRLGVSTGFTHSTPEEWAEKQMKLGAGAVVFPVNSDTESSLIEEYVREAKKSDLLIAEVGVWNNLLAVNEEERTANERYAIRQLEMAEKIGARCCVNVAGTYGGPRWDGGYRENFSEECFNRIVASIQRVIDAVKPVNTFYCIEPMPWMLPTGPDEYLRLIEAVNRDAFAVHMDMVNMINCPQRYFFQEEFMEDVFTKLSGKIRSCHLKDVNLKEPYTFQLEEVKCGEGHLNIEKYIELATKEDSEMPIIIEHIDNDEDYVKSFIYVTGRLNVHS